LEHHVKQKKYNHIDIFEELEEQKKVTQFAAAKTFSNLIHF